MRASLGNFFYVAYDNVNKYDEIVEKNRLRPINTKETLKSSDYTQIHIAVNSDLHEWAQNIEESNKSLAEIRVKSNCLIVSFDKERKHIIVVGTEDNIVTAKLLIDVVLSHQIEVLQHYAENKDEGTADHFSETVTIDEIIIDRLGGVDGEYFKMIKAKYKVELEVEEGTSVKGKYKIAINAQNDKTLQLAKKDLQLNLCQIPLSQKQEGYLKPKLNELQQKSKIICTIVENNEESTGGISNITAIGTEESLKNFKLAIETTLQLESKYHGHETKPVETVSEPAIEPVSEQKKEETTEKQVAEELKTNSTAVDSVAEEPYRELAPSRYYNSGRSKLPKRGAHAAVRYIKKQG